MNNTLTKNDLVEVIAGRTGCTRLDASEDIEALLEVIKSCLESGKGLKVSGFGVFSVKSKSDRRGRNPQSGEAIIISSRRVVTFKPSTSLRYKINRGEDGRPGTNKVLAEG